MIETFTSWLENIFGKYEPILVLDETDHVIDFATNWGYICSVVVLLVFVYFVLKTVGGLIYDWLR